MYLPQVGEIHVAGLPYSQLRQHIHDAVGHIYKSFDLDVEMGQLRSIQVFVVGQARRPGTYTLDVYKRQMLRTVIRLVGSIWIPAAA